MSNLFGIFFPALLSCLIGGIPLNRVHEFNYKPGEIRCDIDYNSVNAMSSQPPSQAYYDILQRGRIELKQLRENPNITRNTKDLKFEEEMRLEEERTKRDLERKRKEAEARKEELVKRTQKAETMELMQRSGFYENPINAGVLSGVAVAVGISGIVSTSVSSNYSSGDDLSQKEVDATINNSGHSPSNDAKIALEMAKSTLSLDNVEINDGEDPSKDLIDDNQNNDSVFFGAEEFADKDKIVSSQLDYDEAWLGVITEIVNDSENGEKPFH